MRFASWPLRAVLALTGAAYLTAILVLVVSRAPLGSPLFFGVIVVTGAAYLALLARVWRGDADRRLFFTAFALAVAFRVPLALAPVGPDSDMIRYLWDGRVQQHGYNPYFVLPSDPALSRMHTPESLRMPSLRTRTSYPPAAQLFFRAVVSIHDSPRAMKIALVLCDLLAAAVVWRWLVVTGRNEWLAMAYAWNPLVVLEVAHSGHIDALGALWIAASAYWLTRRRTALASIGFVLAIATKLLPIVLVPLYWKRIRLRDTWFGLALLAALYLEFTEAGALPLGAVPNVVAHIRFNGPAFRAIAWAASPEVAAAGAVLLGLIAAVIARRTLPVSAPEGWAWPMALSLACAPVVYPWYLLYLTPFLFVRWTAPLTVWSFSALSTYVVWHLSRYGGRWIVPAGVMAMEYAAPIAAALRLWIEDGRSRRGS